MPVFLADYLRAISGYFCGGYYGIRRPIKPLFIRVLCGNYMADYLQGCVTGIIR